MLHGVGEPMLVKHLPDMVRYLKARGTYVLFNTNGTLLAKNKRREIIETGLDELRVSLDAAEAASFLKVRGKDMFDRIVRNITEFTTLQKQLGSATPRVSLWLTGLKETVDELPAFVRLAAKMGIGEVHLQRLVFDDLGRGLMTAEQSLFEQTRADEEAAIEAATALGATLGGDARRIRRHRARPQHQAPERGCAVVHVPPSLVADVFHGAWSRPALLHRPVLGARLRELHPRRRHPADAAGDLERAGLPAIPPGPAGHHPHPSRARTAACAGASDGFLPVGVAVVIPTLNEAEAIGPVVRELPRDIATEIIVADSGSKDATATVAEAAGARVLTLRERGYGRACAARRRRRLARLRHHRVHGRRRCGPRRSARRPRGSDPGRHARLRHRLPHARRARSWLDERPPGFAGHLAGLGMGALYGVRYSDMCAYRAIRRDALERLDMREMTYGWNIEMQMKAARARLRILELPMPYRCRIGGESKVAGSLKGTLRAAG